MFAFDLSLLNEFNPALIYTLEPEASPAYLAGSSSFKNYLYPSMGQFRDMFLAYQYAQNQILPLIRRQGIDKITAEQAVTWIKEIHYYLAHTLLEMISKQAGDFSIEERLSWHAGATVQDSVGLYMLKAAGHSSVEEFALLLKKKFGIPEEHGLPFIHILNKIKDLPNSIVPPMQLNVPIEKVDMLRTLWLKKLVPAYYQNILTAQEKAIVDKIVKVRPPADQIETIMKEYAQKILVLWSRCDYRDLQGISELLSLAYNELGEIAPFDKANEKTAICLINIILRSFNLPSLVFQPEGPSETVINSRVFFTKIKAAIEAPFSNSQLEHILQKRLEMADLLQEITVKYPNFNINKEFLRVEELAFSKWSKHSDLSGEDGTVSLFVLTEVNKSLKQRLESQHSTKASIPFASPLSETQKKIFCDIMETLSGIPGWKAYNTQGSLTILCELNDKQKAIQVIKTLQAFELMKLELKQQAQTKSPVIKCSEINLNKLLLLSSTIKTAFAEEKAFSLEFEVT